VPLACKSPGEHTFRDVTDNCYRDYAQVNAQQLTERLSG
jgi:hypothetical protein